MKSYDPFMVGVTIAVWVMILAAAVLGYFFG